MAERQSDPTFDILAEIVATKMVLQGILEGHLPPEKAERWAELEALVSLIERHATKSVISGAGDALSAKLRESGKDRAIAFVRSLMPKL